MTPVVLSHNPLIRAYLGDCMDLMEGKPDNYWDLAIVDPPYGNRVGIDKAAPCKQYKPVTWDNNIPTDAYFTELKRVSKNQIIWGVNYFDNLKGGRIVWDKDNSGNFSDCELAYQSFSHGIKKFTWRWNGMLQQNMGNKEVQIHPTQKPVSLYRWLLTNYAKPGQQILDTHGGSFSSAIACWHEGYDLDICEVDEEYFNDACERFERETRQQRLFPTGRRGSENAAL